MAYGLWLWAYDFRLWAYDFRLIAFLRNLVIHYASYNLLMSAKSILSKLLGAAVILLAVVYLAFPELLLGILGFELTASNVVFATFLIRLVAIRSLIIGVGMLLTRPGINEHYWLWAFSASLFGDAIVALFLGQPNSARYLVPLWASAIGLLFFVGLAYGLDIAGVLKKETTTPEPEIISENTEPTVDQVENSA